MNLTAGFAENVISARARAMYGHTLAYADYEALLACHSVSEVAAYLKNETTYHEVLSDINEATIHRGYLESRLRRRMWDNYATLMRFDMSAGNRLSDYLMMREETGQLLRLLRRMNVGRAQDYILSTPAFFEGHSKLDYIAVNRAATMAQLVAALPGTPYQKLLAPFSEMPNGELPLTDIETVLYTALIERLLLVIRQTSGTLRQELTDLCGTQIDVQNVTRVLRLKTYFHAQPDEIRPHLLPSGGTISPRTWERLLEADAEALPELFFATRAGRRVPPAHRPYLYDLPTRATYFTARHYMHFSTHPMVVLLSYLIIMDTEVMDLTNIIEGIRYQLPPEEIKPMLVLGMERM